MSSSDQAPLRVYGRRHGRKLRQQRASLLEEALPRYRAATPSVGQTLDPRTLFDEPVDDVWLEVGFGNGEHLAAQAVINPNIGMIGCEPFINGVSALLKQIEAEGIRTIRIVPDDARPVIDALPDASIGRCFVLFPDPWPKTRHQERRFIGPKNLQRLARVLRPGAELRLASDDPGLIRWMLDQTWRHPDFVWLARRPDDWRRRPDDWPSSRYEQKAIEALRTPVFLRFQRRA
ncbi:tRNA (guanine-N(7)-)-methyltransferase [Azospirillaceae bacterium]